MKWVKSSYSESGNCLEWRTGVAGCQVRDSKDPGGPVLTFGRGAWAAFLAGVKDGQFSLD